MLNKDPVKIDPAPAEQINQATGPATTDDHQYPPPLTVSPGRARVRAHGAEIGFAVALLVYAALAILAHHYAYFGWDVEISRHIQSIDLPGFRTFMIMISAPGSGWLPFALVIGTALAMFARGLLVEAIISGVGAGLGSLLDGLLKELTHRPRPAVDLVNVVKHYDGESFPSGHVFFYVNFFGFLFFLTYVYLRASVLRSCLLGLLGGLIILIGVSRVYLGAHWPSDVAGAYLGSGAWLMVMIEIYRRRKKPSLM